MSDPTEEFIQAHDAWFEVRHFVMWSVHGWTTARFVRAIIRGNRQLRTLDGLRGAG
jgi:hypothetical protein